MFDTIDRPAQRVIATTERYEDAEAIIDELIDEGFPVEHVAIVGRDLQYVEHVTGPTNAWKQALAGAGSGLMMGLFFGLLFGIWFAHDGTSLLGIVVYWAIFGAVIGALISLVAHFATPGRHKFASIAGMQARRFDIVVDESFANVAASRLASNHIV
ncbi:MAG: hypothetical protein QOE09_692 [Ilumatobacteraceae bacterium]|jgi:hypothetical protein